MLRGVLKRLVSRKTSNLCCLLRACFRRWQRAYPLVSLEAVRYRLIGLLFLVPPV